MGHLRYRFTLLHESGEKVISEPEGWRKIKLTLERDQEFFSLLELFETALRFYGQAGDIDGGKEYIQNIDTIYGPDAQVTILIEISEDGGIVFEDLFIGLLNMEAIKTIDSRKIEVPIIRDDFWAKFKNRIETPVNIFSNETLDGDTLTPIDNIIINLPSQKIRQVYRSTLSYGIRIGSTYDTLPASSPGPRWPNDDYNNSQYIQLDPDVIELDEIRESFPIPSEINPEIPVSKWTMDYAGSYAFDAYVGMSYYRPLFPTPDWQNTSSKVTWYLQVNSFDPIAFTATNFIDGLSQEWTEYTFSQTLQLQTGDQVRIYGDIVENPIDDLDELIIWGANGLVSDDDVHIFDKLDSGLTHFYVTADTIYPDTSCEAVLIHDVAALVTERITSQTESFYSEYLGSQNTITRQYNNDGCGWNHGLTRGLQLRQYTLSEKPYSISFKQWWESINPIMNLGLGYDVVDGIQVIRVEEKAFFFDPTSILDLSFVNNIEQSYDKDYIFKKVKIGYRKWQSEDLSGLDDPQTNHDYATVFKTIGKEITIQSDAIAASLAVEQARRTTKEKSADYKYDNETFIIALNPTPTGNTYTPELAENFDSVSNLLNYETRYNLTLTPLRNLLRWGNLLNGCLQKNTTSSYKFTGGEGNYDMVSDYSLSGDAVCFNKITDSLSEKQDISLTGLSYGDTIGYLFQPILLQFTHPLSYSDYKLIRDNRTRAIGVSTTDSDHEICFIKKLEYDINISKATFTVWKK